VDCKPARSIQKKPFYEVYDHGIADPTENPETATFPDSCGVTLNLPDAALLHNTVGYVVGVRDPATKKYQVRLVDEDTIKEWGSAIVSVDEDQIKWISRNSWPTQLTEIQNEKDRMYAGHDRTGKVKSLPATPLLRRAFLFVNPPTQATQGRHPLSPASSARTSNDGCGAVSALKHRGISSTLTTVQDSSAASPSCNVASSTRSKGQADHANGLRSHICAFFNTCISPPILQLPRRWRGQFPSSAF
jgi:hypothetical protein